MDKNYQKFSAKIYKIGINPYVDVPKKVSQAFGRRGYVPVLDKLNGVSIRATLFPVGDGKHRLYINGAMRKGAGVDVDDRVQIALQIDSAARVVAVPRPSPKPWPKTKRPKPSLKNFHPHIRGESWFI